MPRPRSLTPDQLATAALAVIDRDGLAGLSMRAVAQEIGMSTMGLYRYVDDRGELEQLVIDRVLDNVDTMPPDKSRPWRERIEIMVERLRVVVGSHPWLVLLIVAHRHRSVAILRWSEPLAAILAEAGLDGRERVVALRSLLAYVVGAIQIEQLGPLAGAGTQVIADRAELPYLSETAGHAHDVTTDEEFHGGLALLLRGIGAGTDTR
ncbi:TetR/AcrR family transcriptional regulator [Nonomuraea sp. CA-143628]|uniref:TetR/AcrR family transcriptional regulator n=1 Tax=Nonomuraea sp. CA-143628 TaxID=3239997 RepID=UPI003D8AA02F